MILNNLLCWHGYASLLEISCFLRGPKVDQSDIYPIVVLITEITGGILVVGGLWLVAKGIVKLVGQEGNTQVTFAKLLTVSTTVPGLGIFLLGFVFEGAALYCSNQIENIPQQIKNAESSEDAKLVSENTLHLTGMISGTDNEDVILSVCVGSNYDVSSNAAFDTTIGPNSSSPLIVTLSAPGVEAEKWTVVAPGMADSITKYDRVIISKDGVGDMGAIKLQQIVDLNSSISHNKIPVALITQLPAAGTAYSK